MRRKICWPFDSVCLEGGCSNCNDTEYKSFKLIDREIEKYSNSDDYERMKEAWKEGKENKFWNRIDTQGTWS